MRSVDYELSHKHKTNPIRLMVLHLAINGAHPADISTVTRVQDSRIRRWCEEDGIRIETGAQPIGLRGLIDRKIITTEQYTKYRELTKGEDLTNIVQLRPSPDYVEPAPTNTSDWEEHLPLSQPAPGESTVHSNLSAESIRFGVETLSNRVPSTTEELDTTIDNLKAELSPRVYRYSNAIFDGLNAMLGIMQDPQWLEKQRAGELAALFAVVSDRGSQLLGSLSSPSGSEEQQDSRLPQRAPK